MSGIRVCLTAASLAAALFVAFPAQAQAVAGPVQPRERDQPVLAEMAIADTPAPETASTALSGLRQDWDRASFTAPTKPAQLIVNGHDGRTTSGSAYSKIVSLMRGAALDVQQGRDEFAMTKIAQAKHLLDPVSFPAP
jgi:hypothetical protein